LRRSCRISSTRDLWVDYICINQKILPERNRQMKYMHEVYRNATEVIA
jgi:Heterokaryon incompatibility protein (HET)